MLRPLYTQRSTDVLLVGPPLSGKRTLAKQLLKCSDAYFSTHIAETFTRQLDSQVGRIDYVLILVDVTNSNSLMVLRETLQRMDPAYLTYKCAIVVTKVDKRRLWAFDEHDLTVLADSYSHLQLFHVNLEDDDTRKSVCDQLGRIIRISTLQQKDVHTMLLRTVEHFPTKLPSSDESMDSTSLISDE
ncbi:uncharacterized protein BYT42DRAFT_578663 [Radiomyces spectabilis]|uniref:uncharacterized protein n=1 Tax=Radiomyces spectabilis TaxID=64574 RepID=UPI002220B7D9|nr:uncharacterized protein BYT42DRAFT_578663 [Radiomyces spectabilis]KAI8372937.1 hypothetical protein BYT42DRAFT_578663 [Radiomyces spectabilis]